MCGGWKHAWVRVYMRACVGMCVSVCGMRLWRVDVSEGGWLFVRACVCVFNFCGVLCFFSFFVFINYLSLTGKYHERKYQIDIFNAGKHNNTTDYIKSVIINT